MVLSLPLKKHKRMRTIRIYLFIISIQNPVTSSKIERTLTAQNIKNNVLHLENVFMILYQADKPPQWLFIMPGCPNGVNRLSA